MSKHCDTLKVVNPSQHKLQRFLERVKKDIPFLYVVYEIFKEVFEFLMGILSLHQGKAKRAIKSNCKSYK